MAKGGGIPGAMKFVIAAGVGLLVWAILGVGIAYVTMYNGNVTNVPTTVLAIGRDLVAVLASIAVAMKFFD